MSTESTTETEVPISHGPIGLGMLMAFGRLGKPVYSGSKAGTRDKARTRVQKASRRANRRQK